MFGPFFLSIDNLPELLAMAEQGDLDIPELRQFPEEALPQLDADGFEPLYESFFEEDNDE